MTTDHSAGIPAILTGQALRALRDAGFSFAAALGEVIDNSIEANANNVAILLEDDRDSKGKSRVRRILISDDGAGMSTDGEGRDVLQHYLQLGYSTRYLSQKTIGKYGVGAKLAAFNFAERIDVWSCSDPEAGWRHVQFDLVEAEAQEKAGRAVQIGKPDTTPVPKEFEHLLPARTGTVVLWSKIDRLEAGRLAPDTNQLRVDLEKELSRTFREFINGGIAISVNGHKLMAHDPLFLMERTWGDKVLGEEARRLAKTEGSDKKKARAHFVPQLIADETFPVGKSSARLRVTLYPTEVTRQRGKGGDTLATKLRVKDNQGQISFMRLDREISYTNVPRIFPRGVNDPDRFIGIEVSFKPELDDYFGVRHVKRGVEPHGELREQIRSRLAKYIPQARQLLEERWGKAARDQGEHTGEHTSIQEAVKEADRTLPKSRVKAAPTELERTDALAELAGDVGKDDDTAKAQYVEQVRDDPFVIESVSFPGQTFIDVQHFGNQVVIRLNTRHRFYRELWEPIREIAHQDPGTVSGEQAVRTARRTLEALSLLVVAYGKAESMDDNPLERFTDLRNDWGRFLDTLLGKVKGVI